MAERFEIRVEEDGYGYREVVIDHVTGAEYTGGGGEPEDQTLTRDWSWVVPLLNELAGQIEVLEGLVGP